MTIPTEVRKLADEGMIEIHEEKGRFAKFINYLVAEVKHINRLFDSLIHGVEEDPKKILKRHLDDCTKELSSEFSKFYNPKTKQWE